MMIQKLMGVVELVTRSDMRTNLFMTILCLMIAGSARGGDWPQWRGPTGQGRVEDTNLPTTWAGKTGENVLWKTALPKGDTPYSSPIVRGDRVFVTLAMNKSREHHVLCFDKKEGKQLWDTEVPPGPWNLTDLRGGYSASTPAADGERVYVLFGSAVLAAIDFEGKIAWRTEVPRHAFYVAIGGSPIVYGETVIIQGGLVEKQ